ncbi:MAG: phage tail protein [Clostridia bacterium]|nr:phage tail protein [Clostridia bacterium]
MIEITLEQIERVQKLVEGVKNGPHRVFYNAVNRGLSKIRTESAKEASSVFAISQETIKSNSRTTQTKTSSGDNVIGQVKFSGNMIPLFKFKVAGSHKQGLKVQVKKGNSSSFKHAFTANLGNGTNVIERITSNRVPTETVFGPSAAHMIGNSDVEPNIEDKAKKVIDERIEHEIERILNGY